MHNVLYVSHLSDLSRGGQRSLMTLVEHLHPERVRVFLLLPRNDELAERFRQLGAEVFFVDFPSFSPKRFFGILNTLKQIRRVLREKSIDIVHSDRERATFYCNLAAVGTSAKVIWHIRVAKPHNLDKLNARMTDILLGISDGVFRRFEVMPATGKRRRVFNGVDLTVFKPAFNKAELRQQLGLPADRQIVAFVGQISRSKGTLELLRAWHILANQESIAVPLLLLIGHREQGESSEKEFNMLLMDARIAEHVREYGHQANIEQWIAAVDAVILPSYNGVEGMGRVMFEAMACRTLALGSNTHGVNEGITSESGVLFEERSPEQIVQAVSSVLFDPALASRLMDGGLQRAREVFDVKIHAQNIQRVYDECSPE